MSVFAGHGNPEWSLTMLWREVSPPGRVAPGPKPALSLDAIVTAAIEIADSAGLGGLSMKAVGERLGRTAMALYTYVPGKNELVDLMYDRVHAELPARYDLRRGWRVAATAWARDLGELYVRHPWLLQISYARPVLGPNEQQVVENAVRILRKSRLAALDVRWAISTLMHYVRGAASTMADARLAGAATGTPDKKWWAARAAKLQEVAPDFSLRFPESAWLAGQSAAREVGDPETYWSREADRAFVAGLDLILDGIATR
ncbi:MAG TPA: TetR/AcrR family transcriptional regulator C-terminal domain-containing protein [Candidatus Limnocylindrales bacterium]